MISKYEVFSSGRQIASIVAIFYFKETLSSFAPGSYQLSWLCYRVVDTPLQCLDLGALVSTGWLQFAAAAGFTAWILQLLPKRLARLDPISYLGDARLTLARGVTWFGGLGLGVPTVLTARWMARILKRIPTKKIRYPVSNVGVLDELAKRLGYYAESLEVRIQYGTITTLKEKVRYRFRQNESNEAVDLNKLIHRTNLMGRWQFEESSLEFSDDIAWTNSTSTRRITDYKTSQVNDSFAARQAENGEGTVGEDVDDSDLFIRDDDDEKVKRIKAETGRSFTRVKAEVSLAETVSSESHKDFFVELETTLVSAENPFEMDGAHTDGEREMSLSFLVSVPVEKLRIVVASKEEHLKPTGTQLTLSDVFEQEKERDIRFSLLADAELDPEEYHGQVREVALPFIGSEVMVRTRL